MMKQNRNRFSPWFASGIALGIAILCISFPAQAQLYKYVDKDGRTVYSDQPPPPDARKVENAKLNKNVIETSKSDYETQQAAKRLPLTLYTTESCAEACQKARDYLNGRGAPFSETMLKTEEQAKPLKARLGGPLEVPLLDIGGNSLQKGFEETAWNSLLEAAGYPVRAAVTPAKGPPTKSQMAIEPQTGDSENTR
jgi:glutaredoxin